jgi:hypothetical protein
VREPSRFEIRSGRDEPPPETRELRAGGLTAQLEGIDLRYVRLGDVEIVRRLFVAVRDASWGTIPATVSGLEVDAGEDAFSVSFEALHEADELRFRWRGSLSGSADGSLDCRLDGVAETDFPYNRIGFCVLHPREHAGRPYRTRAPEGEDAGRLPDEIGAQRMEEGKLWPLFPSYTRLDVEVADGLWAQFEFEGDLFEMEDQRNWTDASFKTYSTQISLGWPHHAKAGQSLAQSVRITFAGRTDRPPRGAGPVRIEVGEATRRVVPPLGLALASHGEALSEREEALIAALGPDHLRADLRLAGDDWRDELERAGAAALATAAGLELALFLGESPEAELEALAAALPLAQAGVRRFLVFAEGETSTPPGAVALAREHLAAAAPRAAFAGGTDVWFTDLNRDRPDLRGADAVVYSLVATVHADDDTSVRETPAAQGDTVRSARALYPDLPVAVSPVTIRPRFWPHGVLPDRGIPFQVDARQRALFGAAWTAASLKHLLEAGVSSATYFETIGWRGVVERESGSPAPEHFASSAGLPFPLYHVLADACGWKDRAVIVSAPSSDQLAVEALALRAHEVVHALVANLTPQVQRCSIGPLQVETASVRVLDEESGQAAGADPESFRARREQAAVRAGRLELELAPYAVVRVDA